MFTKQETINDEDDLQPEGNLINEIETPKPDKLNADQNSFDGVSENVEEIIPVEINDLFAEDTNITEKQIELLENSSERIGNTEEFENGLQKQSYEMNELQSVFTENVDEPVDEAVNNQSDFNSYPFNWMNLQRSSSRGSPGARS